MMKPQARTSRSSKLRSLAMSTALASSLVLLPAAARAQANNTPANPTVVANPGGNAPTFNGGGTGVANGAPTNLTVGLDATNTIIGWDRFNVANGSTVNFTSGRGGPVAVLNRVTGGGTSTIAGALNSDAQISVFLINPNGILVSRTGAVSTGSFVASTSDIRDQDFLDNKLIFTRSGTPGALRVNGSITTRGTGLGLILLGRRIVVERDGAGAGPVLDSGTQDTALVAADNVTLNYTAGSPLGIQITQGSDVGDAMQVVGATVQGRNLYFAMATRAGVTDALLNVNGNLTAVGGSKGIVIVGGASTVDPDIQISSNSTVNVTAAGSLSYEGASTGGVRVHGSRNTTVTATVDSTGSYDVRGREVTLGATGQTILQQADGAVSITASNGDLDGRGTLTLISDRNGAGGANLTLTSSGNIDFDSSTTINSGGSGLASSVYVISARDSSVKLGDVSALTLDGGQSVGALNGGLIRENNIIGGDGNVTLGNVLLGGGANIRGNTLRITSLTAAGDVTLVAQAMDVGAIRSTGGLASLTGDSVTADSVSAVTGATVVTNSGEARVGGITVTGGSASVNARTNAFVTGDVSVAGSYSVTGNAVTLSGNQAAGGAVTVTARTGAISNNAALTLTSNADSVGTEVLTPSGRMNLGRSNSTLNGGAARESDVVITTNGNSNDVNLGNINAAALTFTNGTNFGNDLNLGNVVATGDLSFRASDAILAGNLQSTGGLVSLQAADLTAGNVTAATSAGLSGNVVSFGTVNAATATLATTGSNGTRSLTGTGVTTSGATTLTSSGGAITVDTINAGGGLTVTSAGTATFVTVDVTGTAAITTTGNGSDIRINDALTASGAVTLNSSRDVLAGTLASSGGALTVTAARNVAGVGGGRATLTAATDLVLDAGGTARLGAVSGNKLDLEADAVDSQALSGLGGISVTATDGNIVTGGLTTTGGNVTLSASGSARVVGATSITGDYSVRGNGVTLGGVQNATGAIDITTTGQGSIGSEPGLVLTANFDGVGTEALTLHGRTNLGSDSLLRGGQNRESQVVIDAGANANVTLGDVDASSLAIAGGQALSGSLTFGNVVTADAVSLTVNGGIVAGGLTSLNGAVTLGGSGSATIGTLAGTAIDVRMGGDLAVTDFTASAGDARFTSTGGDVGLGTGSATGNVTADAADLAYLTGAIGAGGSYRVTGARVNLGLGDDAEVQSAGNVVEITATNGAITGGTGLTLQSGGAMILDASGAIDFGAGLIQVGSGGNVLLGVRAGAGQTIDLGDAVKAGGIGSVNADHSVVAGALTHTGDLRFGTFDATGPIDIRLSGGGLSGTALNGIGPIAIDTNGAVDIGTVSASALDISAGSILGGTYSASGNALLDAGIITIEKLESTGGSATAITRAGTLSIDQASAATDLVLTANGPGNVSVGTASAGNNLTITASNGGILTDSAIAGQTLTLNADGDILGRSGGNPVLAGTNVVISVTGSLTTGSITSPGSLDLTAASITIGTASAGNDLSLTASNGALSIGEAKAGGSVNLRATGGIGVDSITSGANIDITGGGAITVQAMSAPGTATIQTGGTANLVDVDTASLVTNTGNLIGGTFTVDTLTLGGNAASIDNAIVAGAATSDLTGQLTINQLQAGSVAFKAGSIVATTLGVNGATGLTSTAGPIDIDTLNGGGAITISAAGDAIVDNWQAPGGMTVTATGTSILGTGTASELTLGGNAASIANGTVSGALTSNLTGALQITQLRAGNLALQAGSIGITNATVTGAATMTSTGAITIDTLASPTTTITAGAGLAIEDLNGNSATLTAANSELGMLRLTTLTLGGGSASIADATISGTISSDLTGGLDIERLSAGEATLLAGGTATLGDVSASNALTMRAGDFVLDGTLRAPVVTLGSRDPAAGLRLGAAGDGQGSGAGLSEAEIARIDTDRVIFDGGKGQVTIGTLAFGANSGRRNVDVVTSGDINIVGVVRGSGTGRTFRFGGQASTSDTAAVRDSSLSNAIRIIATPDAGGRLLFDGSDLELRAARIALGQSSLVDGLFAGGGISADEAAAYIGNSNSPLYSALAGGPPYITEYETTLTAARLTLRFDDFALFQNTGQRGFNSGIVITGSPTGGPSLTLYGPGDGGRSAFAMFGTINGISGDSTAVLGNTVISVNGLDLANARVNGCVLGTGAGCLTTTISQPTLNVFDPGRLVVFNAEVDFTIPFDPVIGSNNEALFAGVGAVGDTAAECPPGEPGCTSQEGQQ